MEDREQNAQTTETTQGSTGRGGRTQEVRQRAIDAYDGVRQKTTDGIDEAPLIALAGGFAVGALIASLLPKTQAEEDLVRPMSRKVGDNARTAAQAAREAGRSRLRELGLTPDAGRDVIRKVVDGISDAARTSSQAAVGSVRGQ